MECLQTTKEKNRKIKRQFIKEMPTVNKVIRRHVASLVKEMKTNCIRTNSKRIKDLNFLKAKIIKILEGTSLVVQWLRIRLPLQGTRVRALVREDPTCRRATKPVCHNYWACEPQLLSPWATTTGSVCLGPMLCNKEKPPQWEAHAPQWRVAPARCN